MVPLSNHMRQVKTTFLERNIFRNAARLSCANGIICRMLMCEINKLRYRSNRFNKGGRCTRRAAGSAQAPVFVS